MFRGARKEGGGAVSDKGSKGQSCFLSGEKRIHFFLFRESINFWALLRSDAFEEKFLCWWRGGKKKRDRFCKQVSYI